MGYTVAQLAKLSGVTVRTLHWYDKIGLLKPAYHGVNGYRFYEEEQLLTLQQILFFRELGFELKDIRRIIGRSDFDQLAALTSHRQVLKKNLERTEKLIVTIDKTIKHIKGMKKMENHEMYLGFSKEKQKEYEKQLIDRFGQSAKDHIAESKENLKGWTKKDFEQAKAKAHQFCEELVQALEKGLEVSSTPVQKATRKHFEWLSQFWTPNKESYAGHGRFIVESELRSFYEKYHPKLPEFLADAIQHFADHEL